MKKKTKNILTSVFGVLFAAGDVGLWLASRLGVIEYDMGIVEILVIAALAYTLIQAYNETLQGFTKKYLGLKNGEG